MSTGTVPSPLPVPSKKARRELQSSPLYFIWITLCSAFQRHRPQAAGTAQQARGYPQFSGPGKPCTYGKRPWEESERHCKLEKRKEAKCCLWLSTFIHKLLLYKYSSCSYFIFAPWHHRGAINIDTNYAKVWGRCYSLP